MAQRRASGYPRRAATRLGSAVTVVALTALVSAACGRSSTPSNPTASSASTRGGGATAAAAGKTTTTFGDLGRICHPGTPKPLSGRGLSGTTIHVGVLSDAGAAATPGLEQEYFDVAKAFTTWCNGLGGINGRTIVADQFDAKLLNGGAQVVNACQKEFMLVGGGNAFDAPDVKPRLDCKLAAIPALNVSPEAGTAPLQVQPTVNLPTVYRVGALRLLADAYPASKTGLGIGGSSIASLAAESYKAQQAWQSLGYKVSVIQQKPVSVNNFRVYMEQLRTTGSHGYVEIASQDPTPEVVAMHDIGWQPDFVLWSIQFYDPKSVEAAKVTKFPPSYVALAALPAELVDQYKILQDTRDIMEASVSKPKFTSFTGLAFSSWALWATAASACGDNLTPQCVLDKAGSHADWTAGGLFPPASTVPGKQTPSSCVLFVRLTPNGFVYDKGVTKPNNGPYNCGPQNLVKVHVG